MTFIFLTFSIRLVSKYLIWLFLLQVDTSGDLILIKVLRTNIQILSLVRYSISDMDTGIIVSKDSLAITHMNTNAMPQGTQLLFSKCRLI